MTPSNQAGSGMNGVTLLDESSGARAIIFPERGALVGSLFCGGRERLFLDEATLRDPSKNVRGGIPVLFPSPGKLEGDSWSRGGKSGQMKQHGFARNLPWREIGRSASRIELELGATEASYAQFPWAFRATLNFEVVASGLRIEIGVENRDTTPMPFGFGFHPYFFVPSAEKAKTRIPTRATRAYDNVTKREGALSGIDLSRGEVDMHLIDHDASHAELQMPDALIGIRGSPELGRWVIWTLPEKDFVCLEPWTAPGNALNSGQDLIELAPGTRRALWLEIDAK